MFDLTPFRRRTEDHFGQMLKSFNEMVEDPWFFPFNSSAQSFRTDIREEKDRYLVEAELPGISKDNIDVELSNDYLTIRAKRDEYTEQQDDLSKMIRKERRSGEFVRRFYVENVDEAGIKAKLDNGILKLEIPKRPDDGRSKKRIEIE
ncbi:Hsp20/alpha crystallin family protein [Paenibacillus physcomitrellae]|uniref:Heat-shock protein n=1 Tax=Paenibacillus physcomitrellae TaxID=1619311 RepID=A0ABQ1G5R1_9BACL|nr:Hsp20/alpha crystallin family protein [Paenibacillus physcomitrellae]GGA36974.1 heat-shock protein [Paenibacillus physcomitrellae]